MRETEKKQQDTDGVWKTETQCKCGNSIEKEAVGIFAL
jgi:hypothetical protein